ncbi:MAG TPA: hypothetical protein VHC49_14085 [Mycobacteriales bacterium]|nr:hypothetical protein [Mycobacteriales bacterium]
MKLMGRRYGRLAVASLAVMTIPVIIAIVYLFLPTSYGGKNCGSFVLQKHQPTTGIADHDKLLDNKVHNAGCIDMRAFNLEVAIFTGGGGLIAIGIILSLADTGVPRPRKKVPGIH